MTPQKKGLCKWQSPLPEEWGQCFHLGPTARPWAEVPAHRRLLIGAGRRACNDDNGDEKGDDREDDHDDNRCRLLSTVNWFGWDSSFPFHKMTKCAAESAPARLLIWEALTLPYWNPCWRLNWCWCAPVQVVPAKTKCCKEPGSKVLLPEAKLPGCQTAGAC